MTNTKLETTINESNQNLKQRNVLNNLIKQNEKNLELLLKSETLIDDCQYLIGKFFKNGDRLFKVIEVTQFYDD